MDADEEGEKAATTDEGAETEVLTTDGHGWTRMKAGTKS